MMHGVPRPSAVAGALVLHALPVLALLLAAPGGTAPGSLAVMEFTLAGATQPSPAAPAATPMPALEQAVAVPAPSSLAPPANEPFPALQAAPPPSARATDKPNAPAPLPDETLVAKAPSDAVARSDQAAPPPPAQDAPRPAPAKPRQAATAHSRPDGAVASPGPAPAFTAAPPAAAAQTDALAELPAAYRAALVRRLREAQRYPMSARNRGEQGVALVRFEIRRDGELTMARLERSTGVAALDHEALALLRRGTLPALPAGWPHPTAAFVVPVTFDLR